MSQKFVMLFLVSKTQTVTLDAAAKVLIEESQDSSSHSKYKSKKPRSAATCIVTCIDSRKQYFTKLNTVSV